MNVLMLLSMLKKGWKISKSTLIVLWKYWYIVIISLLLVINTALRNDIVSLERDKTKLNSDIVLLVQKQKQALIDKTYYGMKDLIPTQFYYLLANSGLDDAIDVLLPPLRTENLAKYSMYKSYFNGARFYEFSKAYHMYLDIKVKILAVNPLLDYTLEQLKTLWLEASTV